MIGRRETNERDTYITCCLLVQNMLQGWTNVLQLALKCDIPQTATTGIGPLMCCVWVVDSQDTPHARSRGVTSVLNHVTAIMYCDGEHRVIHEHIATKVPGDGGRLPREVAVQLTAQSDNRVTKCYCHIGR